MNDFPTVWLRPSKQIRAPLYSVKQRKQRRRIVSPFMIFGDFVKLTDTVFQGHQIRHCLRPCLGCSRCTYCYP